VPGGLTAQHLLFFAILLAAFVLLATERIRNDVVAVMIILALVGTGLLEPGEALAGFASEPAIVVASVFVLSAALYRTGVSQALGRLIARLAGGSYTRVVAVLMSSVALMSAFTHHVTMTAVMLPTTLDLGRRHNIAASKLLLPLSFAASLGTTITIIGAPAFLVASAVLQQAGRPGLGIFSIAPIGLAISALGTLYMMTIGRLLLPERQAAAAAAEKFRLDDYFTELTVLPDSPFLDKTVSEIEEDESNHLAVVGLVRDGRRLRRPFDQRRLTAGDVLLVRTTPENLVAFREDKGVELHPVQQYGARNGTAEGGLAAQRDIAERLVQAVVAPDSDFVGRSIADIDFRHRYAVIVLGLWRRHGWIEEELADVRLRPGDVLVLQGDDEALERIGNDRSFLMLVPFHGQGTVWRRAWIAAVIMAGTVVAATLDVPLEIAGLAGAVAMVLTGCLSPSQAHRSIDSRIFVFIAGAIPLGAAMEKSGTSTLLAGWLHNAVGDWSPWLVLLTIYAVVAFVTEFMSDAATTALLAPVAAALAQALGQPPEPYVVTVAMASVTAFLTPMAHHGNLVVYGPGGYRFWDFARVGAPLTVAIALTVTLMAPLIWR
jgi:di/tricarboxylate transporter